MKLNALKGGARGERSGQTKVNCGPRDCVRKNFYLDNKMYLLHRLPGFRCWQQILLADGPLPIQKPQGSFRAIFFEALAAHHPLANTEIPASNIFPAEMVAAMNCYSRQSIKPMVTGVGCICHKDFRPCPFRCCPGSGGAERSTLGL